MTGSRRIPLLTYPNARPAKWPKADYIVGNPPYIGVRRLKDTIGDGYVSIIRETYPHIPETSDYVMYWWDKAARLVASGHARMFGLITTNSITQAYSRRLLDQHIGKGGKIKLAFAIADHQWVDAADGAAVRIAITVGCRATERMDAARLGLSRGDTENSPVEYWQVRRIGTSLDEVSAHELIRALGANASMCFQGIVPAGDGFKMTAQDIGEFNLSPEALPAVIRRYIIGKDLVQEAETRYIIDFFGLAEGDARRNYPRLYQRLLTYVYPERAENKRDAYRVKWWIFAEPRPAMRQALSGLDRFIVTPYTAKYRPFVFVDGKTLPDAMAYAIASDDAFVLGVLSSRVHLSWSLATGGTLEDRPRYNSNATFFPFPFPACDEAAKTLIRASGEELDAHRKCVQAQHSSLSLTAMYNVLEALRAGRALSPKEQTVHDHGLVSVLRQLHAELDAAVAAAYGWPADLPDAEILTRLVALNAERAAEEAAGHIRWLRPVYQDPAGASTQTGLDLVTPNTVPAKSKASKTKEPWPKTLTERVQAVERVLQTAAAPSSTATLAKRFSRVKSDELTEILDTLTMLGRVRKEAGLFSP